MNRNYVNYTTRANSKDARNVNGLVEKKINEHL